MKRLAIAILACTLLWWAWAATVSLAEAARGLLV